MNLKTIENLIYEYHWRKKELDRIEGILFGSTVPMTKSEGVSQYGVEAVMPKGSPLKSEAEMKDMDLREKRQFKRWKNYRESIYVIELMVDYLENEQYLVIMDCMMEGMSFRAIAAHLGYSREKIRDMKDDMLNHFCQNCHFLHDFLLTTECM